MVIRHPSLTATNSHLHFLSRYGKFLVVGMMNALVDIIVFNLFTLFFSTHSPWIISLYNTVAVGMAICNSYLWNRYWTFSDLAEGTRQERLMFWAQAMLNILINDLVVASTAVYLTGFKSLSPYASSNLAKAVAMFTSSSISYIFLKSFVFRQGQSPQANGPTNRSSQTVAAGPACILPLVPREPTLDDARKADDTSQ